VRRGLLLSLLILAATVSTADARTRTWYLPVGGNGPGNFSINRVGVTRPAHTSSRSTVTIPKASAATIVAGALRHQPAGRAVGWGFQGSPTATGTPMNLTWLFHDPIIGGGGIAVPDALGTGLSSAGLCADLPSGPVSPGRLKVLASSGPAIGGLTPVQVLAESLDIACHRPGGTQLQTALQAG
jgi:hypothetical protein